MRQSIARSFSRLAMLERVLSVCVEIRLIRGQIGADLSELIERALDIDGIERGRRDCRWAD